MECSSFIILLFVFPVTCPACFTLLVFIICRSRAVWIRIAYTITLWEVSKILFVLYVSFPALLTGFVAFCGRTATVRRRARPFRLFIHVGLPVFLLVRLYIFFSFWSHQSGTLTGSSINAALISIHSWFLYPEAT